MNKTQLIGLLDHLEFIYKNDRKINNAWKTFISDIAPDEYAPVMEWNLSQVIQTLKIIYPDISLNLEYYFYEAKWMNSAKVVYNNKSYEYKNKSEFIQSMIDFKYITNE